MSDRYVAFLRGINVGGHAIVSMADLRKSFAAMGFDDVATYIQSGNVVFSSGGGPPEAADIEAHLARDFGGVTSAVVLRSAAELDVLVDANPYLTPDADPKALYVSFLGAPPAAEKAKAFGVPAGASERMTLVGQDVYQYFPEGYGRTKLSGAWLEKGLGVRATTRNWRTVTTLRRMAGE
ncbi:MAG TPA: DUF1697 domain-containing protein [Actinomycetota bacterium]|nr:DUF1697 domain-containing protein [Actinomycetota bacterium]